MGQWEEGLILLSALQPSLPQKPVKFCGTHFITSLGDREEWVLSITESVTEVESPPTAVEWWGNLCDQTHKERPCGITGSMDINKSDRKGMQYPFKQLNIDPVGLR